MEYRGIFLTVVLLSLSPEVFHNGYYFLRCGMSWRQSLQKDKDTICAHEQCLYVSGKKDWDFVVSLIGSRFLALLPAWMAFALEGIQRIIFIGLVVSFIFLFLSFYCQIVCQLCVVTNEHIFMRCFKTLYKLKRIDIKSISQYERVLIPTKTLRPYYADRIHADGEVFKLTFVRGDDALISVLERIVPQKTLEQSRIAAKEYDDTIGKKSELLFLLFWWAFRFFILSSSWSGHDFFNRALFPCGISASNVLSPHRPTSPGASAPARSPHAAPCWRSSPEADRPAPGGRAYSWPPDRNRLSPPI